VKSGIIEKKMQRRDSLSWPLVEAGKKKKEKRKRKGKGKIQQER